MRLKRLGGAIFSVFFGIVFIGKAFLNIINVLNDYGTVNILIAILIGTGFFMFGSYMFKGYKTLAKEENASLIIDMSIIIGIPFVVLLINYFI